IGTAATDVEHEGESFVVPGRARAETALGPCNGAGAQGRLVVGRQLEGALEGLGCLGPPVEPVEDRGLARNREGTIRHESGGRRVGLERLVQVPGERREVATAERGLVLVEQGAAHGREPTASAVRAATTRGTSAAADWLRRRRSASQKAGGGT